MDSKFKNFETLVDCEIKNLKLSQFPLRSVLTLFNMSIAVCCAEEKFANDNESSKCDCGSFISTYSYLFSFLNNCDKKQIGSSALNAFSVFDDAFKNEVAKIIHYGSFCAIAPFVWRKIYKPTLISADEIKLNYKEGFLTYELKDAILTELSSSLSIVDDNENYENYDIQVTNYLLKGKPNYGLMFYEINMGKDWYKEYWYDDYIMQDNICNALGFSKQDYIEFQTFWLALCNYYIKSLDAIIRYMRINNHTSLINRNELLENELLEHMSPLLQYSFLDTLLDNNVGIEKGTFFKIMDIFTIDVNNKFENLDGYYPVFSKFNDDFMFSPFNVRSHLSPRNLLYLLNKNKKQLFNDKVSHLLEVNLIEHTVGLFKKIKNIEIMTNKKWQKSEFDIVIYKPSDNLIFHIQAKGTIPVEGARMTQNLESRMEEGIQQLQVFDELDDKEKNKILSGIFNKKINNPVIINVLLGWGGFGTLKIWEKINSNHIAPLNLSILNTYIDKYSNGDLELKNFQKDINTIIDEIIKSTSPKKIDIDYIVGSKKICFESFTYEQSKLFKYKYRAS